MRKHSLPAPLIAGLMAQPQTVFADQQAWLAHLAKPGFTKLDVTPDPVRFTAEGALWGSVQSQKFRCYAMTLSDDAGQFNVGQHALCWVHAERLVQKLDTFTDAHCAAALLKRFDRIFRRRTGCVTLDRLLKRLHANKAELLAVLDRPATPLHTNGSENDIRCYVTRGKLSAGTRSDIGRDCRDSFLSLAKTCAKLSIEVWDYLSSRLKVAGSASSSRSTYTSGADSALRDIGGPTLLPLLLRISVS